MIHCIKGLLTVLLQTSGRVRHMPFTACLNPSPLQFDLRAVRCHLLGLPFLQNFRQLTVAHCARMCHNSFAVIYFSQTYFTTNKKPRLPFWVVSTSCSFQAVLLQPLFPAFRAKIRQIRGKQRPARASERLHGCTGSFFVKISPRGACEKCSACDTV